VIAPSRQIALDLQDDSVTGSLSPVYGRQAEKLMGVLSGLDYAVYNPATDTELASRYDAEGVENKGTCKTAILREYDLDVAPERPLVVAVGPWREDTGFDLVLASLEGILKQDLALIVAGQGAPALARRFDSKKFTARSNFRLVTSDNEALFRRLYAAADIALCPSPYPTNLWDVQVAQRYGAVPVARRQGAVRDAVVDCDPTTETGTGFLYDEQTPEDLLGALGRALSACREASWAKLRRRVMRLDLSWDRPVRRTLQIYRKAASGL
jgi:starch synthase